MPKSEGCCSKKFIKFQLKEEKREKKNGNYPRIAN